MKLDITPEMVDVINAWREDSSCMEWRINCIKDTIQWLIEEKDLGNLSAQETLSKVRCLMFISEEMEHFRLKQED